MPDPETPSPDAPKDTTSDDKDTPDKPDGTAPGLDAVLPADHKLVKAHGAVKEELKAARQRLKEIDDADKSELDKATESLTAETKRADDAEAEVARLRAAIKHGLTDDDLELLGSGTPEEIEARATRLAERLGDKKRRPTPGLGDPEKDPKPDPDAWLRAAARR